MKALVARTDGTREVVEIIDGTLLHFAQGIVGGFVDVVNVRSRHLGDVSIWVNDEGKLLEMDLNKFASALTADGEYGQAIAGDVVITGGVDGEGNSLGLSDFVAEMLNRAQVLDRRTGQLV